jgi:hypothetical protein
MASERGAPMRSRLALGMGLAALLIAATTNQAAARFIKVDDFDLLELGAIDGQGDWSAQDNACIVAVDPDGGPNQVLAVITDSTHAHRPALVANGTTRMLFARFRFMEQLNFSWGLSDHAYPDQFGHFEVELSMTNASSELRVNDDGTYEVLRPLDPNTWYNVWVLVDNTSDQIQVWLHARPHDPALMSDQLDAEGQTLFGFRSGTMANLVTFFIKTGGGSGPSGPLFIDDIYLEDTGALNLTNPTGPGPDYGDLNCDGTVDFDDINPFVLALTGQVPYHEQFPSCQWLNADCDGDDDVDFDDIDAFVALLSGE